MGFDVATLPFYASGARPRAVKLRHAVGNSPLHQPDYDSHSSLGLTSTAAIRLERLDDYIDRELSVDEEAIVQHLRICRARVQVLLCADLTELREKSEPLPEDDVEASKPASRRCSKKERADSSDD